MVYKITHYFQKIKFAREAAAVDRCHTAIKIGHYDVGLHTYNMLSILRVLWPDAPVRLIWAIHAHDIPERLTGDIPAPSKWFGVVDRNELEKLEDQILDCTGFDHDELSPTESLWLKGIDILELYLWTKDQIHLGNRNSELMKRRIEDLIEDVDWLPFEITEAFTYAQESSWEFMPDLGDKRL